MNSTSRKNRRLAERKGRLAEIAAAIVLFICGYQLVARRYKTHGGEVDLIARKRETLIFVEVKARKTDDDAVHAITRTTQRRISTAKQIFLSRHPHLANFGIRYDIFAIAGSRSRWIKDAWRDDE